MNSLRDFSLLSACRGIIIVDNFYDTTGRSLGGSLISDLGRLNAFKKKAARLQPTRHPPCILRSPVYS